MTRTKQSTEATTEQAPGTAQEQLRKIDEKLKSLAADRRSLTEKLKDTDQRDAVEAVLRGNDIDDVVRDVQRQRESIDRQSEILRKAGQRAAEAAQAERQATGAAQRARLREGVAQAMRIYVEGIKRAHEALRGIEALNAELRKRGHAPFETPVFKRLALPGWDRDMQTFGHALERAGFSPEACGIDLPPAREAAPRIPSPEVVRALRERVRNVNLVSDMPG